MPMLPEVLLEGLDKRWHRTPSARRSPYRISGLFFRLERTIADAPRKKKEEVRRSKARPIVEKFFEWCDAQVDTVLDETPISAAVTYSRNQRVALQRFLDDGRLPVHNNISELNLRRQVVGR